MAAQPFKRCSSPLHVGERELPSEKFYRRKDTASGLSSWCRDCLTLKRLRNQEVLNEKARERYRKNKARMQEVARQYYARNVEARRAYAAKRRREVPHLTNAAVRKANLRNPERMRRKGRLDNYRRRIARQAAKGSIRLTNEKIEERWNYYGRKCWVCGEPATETDHVKPIIKGGSSWPSNLRPICGPCNRRKKDVWPLTVEFLAKLVRLSHERP